MLHDYCIYYSRRFLITGPGRGEADRHRMSDTPQAMAKRGGDMTSEGHNNIEVAVSIENPFEVEAEVKRIVALIFDQFDFTRVDQVFNDIHKLFHGNFLGYRACNTYYHDLNHTTDCLLVMARLIHGAFVSGVKFSRRDVNLGLISALMHDTGYIQTVDDASGSGAKYTKSHIDRSIIFMEQYFVGKGCPSEDFLACANFLKCTGLDAKIGQIKFPTREHELLGKMLGTADLIGQMADKNYLMKLPYLYREYQEGGVPGFTNEFDLLKKTPDFWEFVQTRFAGELEQVDRYLQDHFRAAWGVDQNLCLLAVERNIECIRYILENYGSIYNLPGRRSLLGLLGDLKRGNACLRLAN